MRVMTTIAALMPACVALSATESPESRIETPTLQVDFGKAKGPVRPVNGVGQGPILGFDDFSMFHYLKEAGIPYSRLHDVGGPFGKNIFVDIPNLFRDFDADENDPANYDFAFTDLLMKALVENGIEPYFRLGVTIENACGVKAYRIFPPKDYGKWARICEHVIAHYTEGWADGFRYKITYWEIWNEPDNNIDNQCVKPFRNLNWWGTFDEYLDFYEVAAKHLKGRFPNIKIGGYGHCGFYAITRPKELWGQWGSDVGHYLKCFDEFLVRAKEREFPLDFFSMHIYSDVPTAAIHVDYARKRLDEAGFGNVELHVNEWLPHNNMKNLGTDFQAAEIAAILALFQEKGLDIGCIYDAKCGADPYSPLFNAMTCEPFLAYYDFMAFKELRDLGTSVACKVDDGLYATAATDGKGCGAVLVANPDPDKARKLVCDFGGWDVVSWRMIGNGKRLEAVDALAEIPPSTTLLMTAKRRN
ncbi:MAG: hypothetical protein ILM98_08595 [Kiritimatiellae bacterium]|nr:hypothetical protein [Kiritimatiellia bacterium]